MSMYEEEAKRALREFASSKYAKLGEPFGISPVTVVEPEPGTDYSGNVAGLPHVVRQPWEKNPTTYLLFGGWKGHKSASEGGRAYFKGEIDRGLNVTDVEKLIDPSDIGVDSLGVKSVFWSLELDEWVAFILYTSGSNAGVGRVTFDRDWNMTGYQVPVTLDGSDWEGPESDWYGSPYFVPEPYHQSDALAVYGTEYTPAHGGDVHVARADDFTASDPNFVTLDHDPLIPERDIQFSPFPDVRSVAKNPYTGDLALIYESLKGEGAGFSPYLGFLSWAPSSWAKRQNPVVGMASETLLPKHAMPRFTSHIGHPQLEWFEGMRNPVLFFVDFRIQATSAGPIPRKARLMAVRVPHTRLNPKNYRAITYPLWHGTSISANDHISFPGHGEKTIYFSSDTSGDLSVRADPMGTQDWKTITTESGITSAEIQTSYEAEFIDLQFSASATVDAYAVVRP